MPRRAHDGANPFPVVNAAHVPGKSLGPPIKPVRESWQFYSVVFGLLLLLQGGPASIYAQDATPAAESVPVIAVPPPSPQEQRLAPVPQSFDWMRREVRSNRLLENLIGLPERPSRLFLSITLGEEYSDNFQFDDDNGTDNNNGTDGNNRDGRDEFRTSLTLGTVYRLESGFSFVSLANTVNANYDARAENSEIGYANLSVNAGHRIGRLSLALSESLRRDDDTGEASPSGIRRERRTFLRNAIRPQLRYALSPLTSADLAYTNTLTLDETGEQDITITHGIASGLQHRFSRVVNGAVRYGYTTGENEENVGTQAHDFSAELGYLFDRLTSVSVRGFGRITNRSGGGTEAPADDIETTDSQLYGITVGVRRQLTPFLGVFASLGPTLLDREGRGQRVFVNWQASLDGALPISRRLSLTLSTQQSLNDTTGDVDEVGIVLSQSVTLSLNYTATQDLRAVLLGSYTRTELLESVGTEESEQGRQDNFWRAGISLTYALTRTMSLGASYFYLRRDSNLADSDFDENRVSLTLSANFIVF